VELLASASPYERSYIDASYFRGLAYLRLRKGPEAVAEFRKIADHKGASWGATWVHPNWGLFYSLSYLGMARGFALAGDTARAKKAFQDFFEKSLFSFIVFDVLLRLVLYGPLVISDTGGSTCSVPSLPSMRLCHEESGVIEP
jgi:hypothetical protein